MGRFQWRSFFGGPAPPETEQSRARRVESQRRLAAGLLPVNAEERLKEQVGKQGTDRHFFTSDLSVNELTLAHHAGYQPLGQVMGSSVYHVGTQWRNATWRNSARFTGASWELDVLTRAFHNARHLAIGRLVQEAVLLGATGVIGMRLDRHRYEWGADLLEFVAFGTAIRENDLPAQPDRRPFTSDLSGQEFWALRQGGYRPVQFVVGNCSYCQTAAGGSYGGGWNNREMPEFTKASYKARELAMGRMTAEAEAAGAEGIVGANIRMEARPHEVECEPPRTAMLYNFTAMGTAIVSCPTGRVAVNPHPVVSLG